MSRGSRVCPACGALNSIGDSRCAQCGRSLATSPTASAGSFWERLNFPATQAIALWCLLVYGLAFVTDHRIERFRGSTLLKLGVMTPRLVVDGQEWWRLLSAVFLHFNLLHLVMNLFGLVQLGGQLERRWGAARALCLFLLAGVGGFVVSCFWYGVESRVPTAGASGGIFGQLGALIGLLIVQRVPEWKNLVLQNLAMAVVIGLVMNVNNAAHLGGFVLGFGLGYLFEKERVRPLTTRVLGVLAVCGVLASVGSLLLSAKSPVVAVQRLHELDEE